MPSPAPYATDSLTRAFSLPGSEGAEDDDEGSNDEERQRQRRRARRADRDHNAVLHRRVLNEGLAQQSPSMPLIRGQSDLNARLPFIHTVRSAVCLSAFGS